MFSIGWIIKVFSAGAAGFLYSSGADGWALVTLLGVPAGVVVERMSVFSLHEPVQDGTLADLLRHIASEFIPAGMLAAAAMIPTLDPGGQLISAALASLATLGLFVGLLVCDELSPTMATINHAYRNDPQASTNGQDTTTGATSAPADDRPRSQNDEAPSSGPVISPATDEDRPQAEKLFSTLIDDPSRKRLRSRRDDQQHLGGISEVLICRDDQELIAAAHFSAPYTDMHGTGLGAPTRKDDWNTVEDTLIMLHSIAVAPGWQSSGIGAQLMRALEDRARASGRDAIYGVCSPEVADFYRYRGYTIGEHEEPIVLQWGTRRATFPIEGEDRWFWKVLTTDTERDPVINARGHITVGIDPQTQKPRLSVRPRPQ